MHPLSLTCVLNIPETYERENWDETHTTPGVVVFSFQTCFCYGLGDFFFFYKKGFFAPENHIKSLGDGHKVAVN